VDYFGRSLSLNGEGNILALAQENKGYGSGGLVRVYKWEAPSEGNERYHASLYSWIQMGDDITSEAGENRADSSIILSESGATVAIADNVHTAAQDTASTEEATSRGHVRVFQWSNTAQGWRMKGEPMITEHIGNMRGERAAAKPSISMDGSGALVSVGSPAFRRRTGHVRSFRWNATASSASSSASGGARGAWMAMGGAIAGEKVSDLTGACVSTGSPMA
jgi:hypothetical protein